MRLLGAVLAGGRSSRYGRDKAMELVAGVPMLHRAIHALQAATDDVVVISCNHADVPKGIRALADARPGHGPLGGLHTALLEAVARELRGVLLLGCDLPLVSGRVLAAIAAQAETSLEPSPAASLAAAPSRPGGVEPLCAVYGCAALPLVEGRLDGPDLSMHSLFRALDGRELSLTSLGLDRDETFLNVNTPEDLVRAHLHQDLE